MLEVRSLMGIEENPLGDFYEVTEINEHEGYVRFKVAEGIGMIDLRFATLRFKNEDGTYYVFNKLK